MNRLLIISLGLACLIAGIIRHPASAQTPPPAATQPLTWDQQLAALQSGQMYQLPTGKLTLTHPIIFSHLTGITIQGGQSWFATEIDYLGPPGSIALDLSGCDSPTLIGFKLSAPAGLNAIEGIRFETAPPGASVCRHPRIEHVWVNGTDGKGFQTGIHFAPTAGDSMGDTGMLRDVKVTSCGIGIAAEGYNLKCFTFNHVDLDYNQIGYRGYADAVWTASGGSNNSVALWWLSSVNDRAVFREPYGESNRRGWVIGPYAANMPNNLGVTNGVYKVAIENARMDGNACPDGVQILKSCGATSQIQIQGPCTWFGAPAGLKPVIRTQYPQGVADVALPTN